MSFKEVTRLRKEQNLEEAWKLANNWIKQASASQNDGDLLWAKRAMSWVLYDFLDKFLKENEIERAAGVLDQIKRLDLGESEHMFFERIPWKLGSLVSKVIKQRDENKKDDAEYAKNQAIINKVFEYIRSTPLERPSKQASFILAMLHKGLKDTYKYTDLIDWFGLENLQIDDYKPEKLESGKTIMSLAEQIYSSFTSALLEKEVQGNENPEQEQIIRDFIDKLDQLEKHHPEFKFTLYNKARLLAHIGEFGKAKNAIIPFVKENSNEYWAWEQLGDLESDQKQKVACYCKALEVGKKPEFLVKVRLKLSRLLINKNRWDEAKTEIELFVSAKQASGAKIPEEVAGWQDAPWYAKASTFDNNNKLYSSYQDIADQLLYTDIPEELIVVTFINEQKQILNFLKSRKKEGFFKYKGILDDPKIGDVLRVRLKSDDDSPRHKIYTAYKTSELPSEELAVEFNGSITRKEGQQFAFISGAHKIFVEPKMVDELDLAHGERVKGRAIANFNKKRNEWGLKAVNIERI